MPLRGRAWMLVVLGISAGACQPREPDAPRPGAPPPVTPERRVGLTACGDATTLVIATPLALDQTAVRAGQILTGRVTYQNCSAAPISLEQIAITSRPPGGTHAAGPYDDLTPARGATTIAAGDTLTVTASRSFTASDPAGAWITYATYQDAAGAWHDGPDVTFSVAQQPVSSVPTNPIAFARDSPFTLDSGTTNYVYVPSAYDSTHHTPITLFVWLHGCGGFSSGDVWTVSPGGAQSWITLAVGGAEGACWDLSTDPAKVLAAIAELETHFNIDRRSVILGGYSSGGDLTYRTAFYNASLFAGVLVTNSTPFRDTGSSESASLAAASWKLNVVQLAHLQDTTYPIDQVRTETDALKAAGFPMTRLEVDGGHWDDAGAIENGHAVPGTDADIATYLLPYLNTGWKSP